MYKTIQNDNTGVIHVAYGVHHPITHCGAVNSYSENIYVQRYATRVLRNRAVTCKNCLRMLAATPEEGGGEHMHVRPHKLPETPKLTVDAIIQVSSYIVLIERKFPPLGYAFPGGFVDVGESCEDAVVREVKEETGIDARVVELLGAYSNPKRDRRGHIVSLTYVLTGHGIPEAADDAKEAFLIGPGEAMGKKMIADHHQMLLDFIHKYRGL